MTRTHAETVAALLARHDRTYAQEAGIALEDSPAPLYQLLVLANLLSARIGAGVAVASARELFAAGCRTPEAVRAAPRRKLIAALGRGGYARYDERTTTMLRDGADLLLDTWDGDLRQLRDASDGPRDVLKRLQEFPGIGPTGAAIFAREAQGVWPVLAPHLDKKALDGAGRLGLPQDASALADLVTPDQLPVLASGLVRVALHRGADDPLG
ncbi:endonuclease [Kocuria tytonicola]|uniref:endonuclease n=1 Tax=Kocuria tytonicola TaxID=2055946 RepID=UPI000EF8BB36|nr:endonuclease [Kocuria tytonicola]RLZ03315.1 endonuclease [Kocuria tytonicola]